MRKKYWLLGATYEGKDDMYEMFIKRGCWQMFYDDKEKPDYASLRAKIREGDRVAIKAMLGQGSPKISIRALGIVKANDGDEGRLYVNWLRTGMNRKVPSRGCYKTIHGPYTVDDCREWLGDVFRI
jgi:hypothetical protein